MFQNAPWQQGDRCLLCTGSSQPQNAPQQSPPPGTEARSQPCPMLVPLLGEEMRAIWEVWRHLPFGSFPGGCPEAARGRWPLRIPPRTWALQTSPRDPVGKSRSPLALPLVSVRQNKTHFGRFFARFSFLTKKSLLFLFFPGNVFSSLAPQPASPSLSSFLLAHKAASLAFAEFWRDITASNVFFLLPGSYQPPAEEHGATYGPCLCAHGAQK